MNNDAIFIDNLDLREVGFVDSGDGLDSTFDGISELAHYCKFKDCTHMYKFECAILNASKKKKDLKELGIKKQFYAVYNDTIITSGKTRSELEKKIKGLISDEEKQKSIFYFRI